MYSGRIETCSKRLAQALAIKGMKQSELCDRANVPKSSLSLYLSGAYEPRQDRIYEMATVLDVDPVWLMGYDVPMKKQKNSTNELPLTDGDIELLQLFNRIPAESQAMLKELLVAFDRIPLESQPMVVEMIRVAVKNLQ